MNILKQLDLFSGVAIATQIRRLTAPPANPKEQPLVACWGVGQDSSGMIIGMIRRGIIPKLVMFAGVGSERHGTYAFRPLFDDWLEANGAPRSTEVIYQPKKYKHWPPYYSLLENCLTNVTLPSLAYGGHTCSQKWKIAPINKYIATLEWAQDYWASGGRIRKAIGFDDSPHEHKRAERGCNTFAVKFDEAKKYEMWYPLQEWGWTREDCVKAIEKEGLPVPPKSSCFFCPAMKPHEVDTLQGDELKIIVVIEARTRLRHLGTAEKRGWPRGKGVPLIEGLWRRAVKGMRGATPRPGSMTQYIREKGMLPAATIDRIIERTPTQPLSQADFERLGFRDWKHWLEDIINN